MTRRYEDALEDYGKSVLSGKRKDSTIYIADPPSRQRVSNAVTVASLNDSVPDAIGNLARQPANDTILNNARRDGIEVAVVCAPNACAFCRTAASRGWSKAENRTIWSQWNGGMHGNCHCAIAPRMGKGGGIDGYSFRELREEYDAADGETSADKIRAMRRSDYEKNGDKIRAQKREAYGRNKRTLLAAKERANAKIPDFLKGNYDDFEELALSKEEHDVMRKLHSLSRDNSKEYAVISINGVLGNPYSSNIYDRVEIDFSSVTKNDHVKVFHSHTDDSPFSRKDFRLLLRPQVDEIGVVTANGDIFSTSIGSGYRPTIDEFEEIVDRIYSEVNNEIVLTEEFADSTIEERNYLATRETAYRIARHFGFTYRGGAMQDVKIR